MSMTDTTDATRCAVCGGPFSRKRVIIDGMAYHERCSIMSYPSHTHEDYERLSRQLAEAQVALRQIELNARDGDPLTQKLGWVAREALAQSAAMGTKE
jgi:hypothetical protein